MRLSLCSLVLLGIVFSPSFLVAGVTGVEILEQKDIEGTTWEELRGRLHFAVDPAHPRNRIIADLERAPVNEDGLVEFSSDFRLSRPKDGTLTVDAAWVEIPNRGSLSRDRDFLLETGFVVLEVGWEFDVPPAPGRLSIQVPVAKGEDGSTLRGPVDAIFLVNEPVETFRVTDLAVYPPVDPAGPETRLVARASAAFPGGEEIPREQWHVEDGLVALEGGFQPGITYEITWLAEDPPVAGLGFAAIRDAVSWLKHDPGSLAQVSSACAFGASQCGRLLRDFVHHGFNTDEQDRAVLDGVLAQIAGAGRLGLNRRWATPRELALFRAASYPFADAAVADPVTGRSEGILENARVAHRPRIFYTNTSAEYWGAGRVAALVHTDPEGRRDLDLPEEVRLYVFAGTQHGPASFPPTPPAEGAPLANPVNFRPAVRALRLALHRWVSEGASPPPSAYPRLDDSTLVTASDLAFPELPGIPSPRNLAAGPRIANPLWSDDPGAGTALPLLVPQVDADGNELAGIRLPEVAVPLGTATGWMFRPPPLGAAHELLPVLRGSWIPFAPTEDQRREREDPRPSIRERYDSREDYLGRVRKVIEDLAVGGYFPPGEVEDAMEAAAERWDWLAE